MNSCMNGCMHAVRARSTARLLSLCLSLLLPGCATSPPSPPIYTVDHVDLQRYMGDWYVIGEIPNLAEKHCFDSVESYALRADGHIDNWFSCRKKSFDAPMKRVTSATATVVDHTTNASWSLHFYKVITVDYSIIDLDPGYQWVMIGHPSRRWGWILARTPTLPDDLYQSILARSRMQDYDPAQFVKVPQSSR